MVGVSRMKRHFERRGGPGEYSGLFDAMPPAVQEKLLAAAQLRNNEEPAIVSYQDEANWALVTSERLLWTEDAVPSSIPLSEVTDIAPVLPGENELDIGKADLSSLRLTTNRGFVYQLRVEPGRPFFGFWNVLRIATGGAAS